MIFSLRLVSNIRVGVATLLIPPSPRPSPPLGEREKRKMVGRAHPTQHRRDACATRKNGGHRPPYERCINVAIS